MTWMPFGVLTKDREKWCDDCLNVRKTTYLDFIHISFNVTRFDRLQYIHVLKRPKCRRFLLDLKWALALQSSGVQVTSTPSTIMQCYFVSQKHTQQDYNVCESICDFSPSHVTVVDTQRWEQTTTVCLLWFMPSASKRETPNKPQFPFPTHPTHQHTHAHIRNSKRCYISRFPRKEQLCALRWS